MNQSEKEYIALCKQRIGEKFHFGNGNGPIRQRDLESLADNIEESCGIKLSLSTLKRLWKEGYEQTPHPSTLQALVSVLGYRDWPEFKSKETFIPAAVAAPQPRQRRQPFNRWITLPVILIIPVLFWLIAFRSGKPGKTKPVVNGPIIFSGNKTVAQGVPSTIIFNYDVANVKADSFFFQQAWNAQERVKIDPNEHYYSNIYYYPGYHKAKLIANDSILRIFPVHITTDGWLPIARYQGTDALPIYCRKEVATGDGVLHATRGDLASSGVNIEKDFLLSYYNTREFGGTSSDNFSLATRIACDSSNTVPCPGFELVITCETHIFFVRLVGKGCERDIAVKMGEVYRDGSNNDLSMFGRNLYQWQNLEVRVVNKKATIYLDEQPVYTIPFKNNFGKIVGLVYNFTGTGAIDFVKLKNGEGKLVYEDAFGK